MYIQQYIQIIYFDYIIISIKYVYIYIYIYIYILLYNKRHRNIQAAIYNKRTIFYIASKKRSIANLSIFQITIISQMVIFEIASKRS